MQHRVETFDIAKALGIILVVIGHFNPADSPSWWLNTTACIYSFHMPLFLAMSGFLYAMTSRRGDYFSFAWKKVKRLMIPYLSTSLVVITFKLLTQGQAAVEHPVSAHTYLELFYLPAAGFFLWFVWALFEMFLLVRVVNSRHYRLGLFVVSIVIYFLPWPWPEMFCLEQLRGMMVYFMAGVMVVDFKRIFRPLFAWGAHVYIPAFVVSYAVLLLVGRGNAVVELVAAAAGIAALLALSRAVSRRCANVKQVLLPVGEASFTIYLFHTTFEGAVKAVIGKLPALDYTGHQLLFAFDASLVVLCGVLMPMVLHGLFRRYRLTRFLLGMPVTQPLRKA